MYGATTIIPKTPQKHATYQPKHRVAMEPATVSAPHLTLLLNHILLFFGIAGIVVPLLQRLRMSPVLAYLLCGVLIGPFGLGALADRYPWLAVVTIKEIATVQMLGKVCTTTVFDSKNLRTA